MIDHLQIAIDGPVGSGKSEISRELAKQLGIMYVYTGAMYRAIAHECLKADISLTDVDGVVHMAEIRDIQLDTPEPGSLYPVQVRVDGQDVTRHLFDPVVESAVAEVSKIPELRKRMVHLQQEIASTRSVVMEGRDIAIRVLPNAQIKIYLTASLEERARRRLEQYMQQGINQTIEEVMENTRLRDIQDMTRAADPLTKVDGAWEYDTSGNTVAQSVEGIKNELRNRGLL
jgi:cytidylate kinase